MWWLMVTLAALVAACVVCMVGDRYGRTAGAVALLVAVAGAVLIGAGA